jgi:hypothetical protein
MTANMRWLTAAAAALAVMAGCAPKPLASANGAPAPGGAPSGGAAVAATGDGAPMSTTPVSFTDPTEGAFTIQAPAGWSVKGGVNRVSPWAASPWTVATSPDGASTIAVGDPSIPSYTLPSQMNAVGSTVQGASGAPSPVEPYENGAQFAATYAQNAYGGQCGALQPAGGQAEPQMAQTAQSEAASVAQQVGVPPAPISYDGGSAYFTCQAGGATYAVGVIAVTGVEQTQVGGFWLVPILIAYRAPVALQAQIDAAARAMRQSYQVNPQWQAQLVAATRQQLAVLRQQGAQGMAEMNQLQQRQFAAEDAQMQGAAAARNAQHAAFMAQFNAQGAAFQAGQARQAYNQETEAQGLIRFAGDQTCIAWYDAAHTRCRVTAHN